VNKEVQAGVAEDIDIVVGEGNVILNTEAAGISLST